MTKRQRDKKEKWEVFLYVEQRKVELNDEID